MNLPGTVRPVCARRARYYSLAAATAVCSAGAACKAAKAERALEPSAQATVLADSLDAPHVIRVYVSAVNCEMNAADAARVNALSHTSGLAVEVVFTGIAPDDSLVLRNATRDLGLTVPVRLPKPGELVQYKSIGGVQLPMALVIKARQLKTFIAGESMPRTLSLLEASMSSMGGQ